MCDICSATQTFDPNRHAPTFGLTLPGWEPEPEPVEPLPVGSNDELATYLVSGFWADNGGGQRSFGVNPGNVSNYVITVDVTGLTTEGQRLARWALDTWELVADFHFTEVETNGDIDFDDEEAGAFSISDVVGTEIISSTVNVAEDWITEFGATVDSYAFSTYVHEIGHALGLGHLGNYNGSISDPTFANDSYQVSVMSYFDQEINPDTDASYAEPVSPMMADIQAIQSLYGTPTEIEDDTSWGIGGTFSRHFATLFAGIDDESTGPTAFTIYDGAGTDEIILTQSTTNDRLDMSAESFSDIAGLVGNLGIARDTIIENVNMGSGHDTVTGNAADNVIHGNRGRDILSGGSGDDKLGGGRGRDQLFGGVGDDKLVGGSGQDRLFGGTNDDKLLGKNGNDRLQGGEGNDTLIGGNGQDRFFYGFGEDRDKIKDFELGVDTLVFSAIDFGDTDSQDLVDTYGRITNRGMVLEFGSGEVLGADSNDAIVLLGIFDPNALVDDIFFL